MTPLPPTRPASTSAPTVPAKFTSPHATWSAWASVLPLLLALISPPVWPHGGEDHGDERPPATPTQQAPRASAQTDAFELVVVLDQRGAPHQPTLTIYLDKADTNEPVDQASIDVESGAFKAAAKPVAPGVYSVPAAALAKPGRYPLTFTVQSTDSADLLDATLVTTPHEPTAGHEANEAHAPKASALSGPRARWPWLAAGVTLLIAATWLGRRLLTRKRTLASTPSHGSNRHTD